MDRITDITRFRMMENLNRLESLEVHAAALGLDPTDTRRQALTAADSLGVSLWDAFEMILERAMLGHQILSA